MATPHNPVFPQGRGFPVNETIAVASIVALVVWGVITWSGQGGQPLDLGPLDPGRFFPGRGLTRADLPLVIMLVCGGLPLVWGLLRKLFAGTFGSDLLAGISIITSILLGEYLAGVLVVLMLSGGEALESRRHSTPMPRSHRMSRRSRRRRRSTWPIRP
jgi:cation transport ATPase